MCGRNYARKQKKTGYVQLSWEGANKFCVLQELVVWAQAKQIQNNDQCSHLCHNPKCTVLSHIILESSVANNARKNCSVFLKCHHCDLYIFTCVHHRLLCLSPSLSPKPITYSLTVEAMPVEGPSISLLSHFPFGEAPGTHSHLKPYPNSLTSQKTSPKH